MTLAKDAQSPAIVRATALADLRPYLSAGVMPALEAGLADPDPMVRGAALDVLLSAPPQERIRLGLGVIDDPSTIVRIKAARVLAIMPAQGGDAALRAQLDQVFAEYVASQRANADRPEAHLNLGLFYMERRDPKQAEAEYRAALALQADFIPADVNLADLYRIYSRDADAEKVLTERIAVGPRQCRSVARAGTAARAPGTPGRGLAIVAAATRADPNNPRYAYVYGVALHDSGQQKQGLAVLERALARFPRNPDLLSALAAYARDAGDNERAASLCQAAGGHCTAELAARNNREIKMNSTMVSLLAVGCTFGASLVAIFVRDQLPSHHVEGDSKDLVKLVMGLIATLTALVLGLLISSSHSAYDTQRAELQQLGVHLYQVDRVLAHFGPDATEQREVLRRMVAADIERVWPTKAGTAMPGAPSRIKRNSRG